MTDLPSGSELAPRSAAWRQQVAGVLLLATFANYANRIVLNQNSRALKELFSVEAYANAETAFGLGFAFGGPLFGICADYLPVRRLYPFVVLAWSLAGVARGQAVAGWQFVLLSGLLGFFESGHWPCALRTTQRTFLPAQRTWGNSVLQSGAAIASILTPLGIAWLYVVDPANWRLGFVAAAATGPVWVVLWLLTVTDRDLAQPVVQTDESGGTAGREMQEQPLLDVLTSRRFFVLLGVVLSINTVWHYIRVWMPDTLEGDHGYAHEFVQYFTSAYYLMTFLGSLFSGWLTAWLGRRGQVHQARLAVFFGCACLTSCSALAAFAPKGPLLLGSLLLVAAGSLGLFPIYYSLNQELSAKHQGKVGGALGFCAWSSVSLMQYLVGLMLATHPGWRPYLFAVVGFGPLLGWLLLVALWGRRAAIKPESLC